MSDPSNTGPMNPDPANAPIPDTEAIIQLQQRNNLSFEEAKFMWSVLKFVPLQEHATVGQSIVEQIRKREQSAEARGRAAAIAAASIPVINTPSISTPQIATPQAATPRPESPTNAAPDVAYRKVSELGGPPKFNGKRDNDAVEKWIHQLEQYFVDEQLFTGKVATDAQKLIMSRNSLEGDAKNLWTSHAKAMGLDGRTPVILNFSQFIGWARKNFSEIDAREKRWKRFEKIKQGKNESFQTYAVTKREAALFFDPPLSDDFFIRSLVTCARKELLVQWTKEISQPTDVDAVIDRFVRWENGLAIAKTITQSNTEDDDRMTEPMDLSAAIMSKDRPKKKTAAWKPWCIKNKACFNCGRTGHGSKTCRQKKGSEEEKKD
jgi:hypothetical protein